VLQYDFEESIGFWLVRAWNAYERALNAELTPRGITFRQAQVLGFLALEGDLSQVELADRIKVEPPTLVGILDRMERDGWITRIECADDRRKKIIRPTPQAEPVWAKVVDAAMRVRARAVENLPPNQVEQLKVLLSTMEQNLGPAKLVEERAR
jgi:MarR family transcriptional regulator, transcriptional regulator for hemolysin